MKGNILQTERANEASVHRGTPVNRLVCSWPVITLHFDAIAVFLATNDHSQKCVCCQVESIKVNRLCTCSFLGV